MSTNDATLLLVNGTVVTMSPGSPAATAVAAGDDRILALGTNSDILRLGGPNTRIVDLKGRTVLPGLADSHLHLVYYGLASTWLSFNNSPAIPDILSQVRQRAATLAPGSWIYGRAWDHERLAEGRGPTRAELDAAAPHNPVLLARRDGHLCVANTSALHQAGITADTPSPSGGDIIRDPSGDATGELSEAAIYLAWNRMIDQLTVDDFASATLRAAQETARVGLTSAHCILLENIPHEIQAIHDLAESERLPLSCYLIPSVESLDGIESALLARISPGVRTGAAKIFADGTVFGHSAALREPYADRPEASGVLSYKPDALRDLVARIQRAGLQPAIHASGDRTIESCLDAFQDVYGSNAAAARPRLEHATVVGPDLKARMAAMGVIASVQPRAGDRLERRLGPARAADSATLRPFLDSHINLAGGSDAPFAQPRITPLEMVQSIVENNGLTVEETWALFSRGPAFAAFAETDTGELRPGLAADLVVLDDDPRRVPAHDIASIPIAMTVSRGRVVWEAPSTFG